MRDRLSLRGAWLRFYPVLVTLTLITQRALAGDVALPEFDVIADEFAIPGVRFYVAAAPSGPVRAIYADVPGLTKKRVRLRHDRTTGLYEGYVSLPAALDRDAITVRIIAHDRDHNRVEQRVRIPVLADPCCEDEETCGLLPAIVEEVERGLRARS